MSSRLRYSSCALTDKGNVRNHNEDACLDAGDRGLWVVADGMGGHSHGDYASNLIVERLSRVPGYETFERPSAFVDCIEDRLLEVNRHLYEKSMEGAQPQVIGSTVAALLAFGRYCLAVWAGDSRVYRWRDGRIEQISRDHSEIQNLISRGVIRAEDAESHPQANVITRAVGGTDALYLDYELKALKDRDRFLLCSDGLYKEVATGEMQTLLQSGDCASAAESLLKLALSRDCNDNVTVIVVDFAAEEDDSTLRNSRGADARAAPDG